MAHGAKLFYLSGMRHGRYMKRDVLNLARFISVAKTKPLSWRIAHPYLVADRFEVRRSLASTRGLFWPSCCRFPSLFGHVVRDA